MLCWLLSCILLPRKSARATRFRRARLQLLQYVLMRGSRLVLTVIGYRVREKNARMRSRRARVIVSNHVSALDFFVMLSLTPCSFVAKRQVRDFFLIGSLARGLDCVFTDRDRRNGGTVARILQHVRDADAPPIVVFPEGTTMAGSAVAPFRTGAFVAACAVQPVALRHVRRPWNFHPSDATCSLVPYLLRHLAQPRHVVEVEWLAPVYPNAREVRDPAAFAETVRRRIAHAKSVPLTPFGYREKKVYMGIEPMSTASEKWQRTFAPDAVVPDQQHGTLREMALGML